MNAHSAFHIYEIITNEAHKKVEPGLRAKPKGQVAFLVMLMLLGGIGGGFSGLWIDQTYIHPAQQLVGVCAPPAQLFNVGQTYGIGGHVECLAPQIQTTIIDGIKQNATIQVPAAKYFFPNGTAFSGIP